MATGEDEAKNNSLEAKMLKQMTLNIKQKWLKDMRVARQFES